VPEGGELAAGQVGETVELDEILRSFDEPTRRAFQTWMAAQAEALDGHGKDVNDALGNLGPFAEDASVLVDVLNRQEGAVEQLVRDTGVVFEALTERRGQLRDLVRNANDVFAATASRDRELQETFTALPTFERESRTTVRRLAQFAGDTDPLVMQLRPAARELSPALRDLSALAPDLRTFFRELGPLIDASVRGFPAAQRVIRDLRPLLGQLDPAGRQLNPMLEGIGMYKRELTAFLANTTAATQAFKLVDGRRVHYLRTTNPLNLENLAAYPRRLPTNRTNAYMQPGGYDRLRSAGSLDSYETRQCNRGPSPSIIGAVAPAVVNGLLQPVAPEQVDPLLGALGNPQFIGQIQSLVQPNGTNPAPPCRKQGPFPSLPLGDELTQYPHVKPAPAQARATAADSSGRR
jgi:ABC-type transporter Mla subunit MlaD